MSNILNGLDLDRFPPIAFVDLDGVVFEEGTNQFRPGALGALDRISHKGWKVCFFSSALSDERLRILSERVKPGWIAMAKPLGAAYCLVDDRCNWATCANTLNDRRGGPHMSKPYETPIWDTRPKADVMAGRDLSFLTANKEPS